MKFKDKLMAMVYVQCIFRSPNLRENFRLFCQGMPRKFETRRPTGPIRDMA